MVIYRLIFPDERFWAVEGTLAAINQESPNIIPEKDGSWIYTTENPLDTAEFVTMKQYAGADIFEME